jgi:hypothetical protein
MRHLSALVVLAASGCSSFAGVDLAAPIDRSKQRCIECALRAHTDPESLPAALARFRDGCDGGDARSCSVLGVMYETGRGAARDLTEAKRLFGFACREGNGRACNSLGSLSEAEGDLDGAQALYQVGCHGAHPEACHSLGGLLRRRGDGAGAEGAYALGCKRGDAEACEGLGVMLLPSQPRRARKLLDRACHAGRTEACERLEYERRVARAGL